jgi:transcriptional regulator with XRE-family HTH domain
LQRHTLDGYCSLVAQDDDWAARMAADIGKRIARLREERKMSAQQLAGRCAELGMPSITRIVITRLENGRRETLTTAEAQVIGAALGAPPIELIFPVATDLQSEILPGGWLGTLDAVRWYAGDDALMRDAEGNWLTARSWDLRDMTGVGLLSRHEASLALWRRERDRTARLLEAEPDDYTRADSDLAQRNITAAMESLHFVRGEMRYRGMPLPDLEPELDEVDSPHWPGRPPEYDAIYRDRPGAGAQNEG